MNNVNLDGYKGKRVLITGHTGFKGSWMSAVLIRSDAEVVGYALEPPTNPALFEIANMDRDMKSVIGDVRDCAHLMRTFEEFQPEIVIHMAAQPLVRESYLHPLETYETNVMGTVNLLECVRKSDSVKSVVNVTTDKVYRNVEQEKGYIETDELDGYDPYSNSKSCSDILTHSYRRCFFSGDNSGRRVAVSIARAGNVIGGGDFASNRIVPDCVRAAMAGEDIVVRNPHSIRPYQHVLEPVCAYLELALKQMEDASLIGEYNIGPDESDCVTTGTLVDSFVNLWGDGLRWIDKYDGGPHEASFLKLDCTKAHDVLGWKPRWNVNDALDKTVEWTKCWIEGDVKARECMEKQVREYVRG
ncbi:MAG: CDP-glucose 4,6-dehydratase [Eubacterium sp.]|nr:CDP-glucose 4,6-dehydratase [Eubacterium sp.]